MNITENVKITVFGDSIGKGVITDGGKIEVLKNSAVSLFEENMGVEIQNRSVYGQSLKRIYDRAIIDNYLNEIDTTCKNVAVIELGGNDADFNWRKVSLNPNENHESNTSIKDFSKMYHEVIEKLMMAGVKVITCTIVPIDSERFFNNVIGALADKNKVLEFFKGDFNTIHRHQEMFNNEILKNSYRYGIPVIDLRRKFLESNEFENLMCRDGIHPNLKGHYEIYGAIGEFLVDNSLGA